MTATQVSGSAPFSKQMPARYATTCCVCRSPIQVGDVFVWTKGASPSADRHPGCTPAQAEVPARPVAPVLRAVPTPGAAPVRPAGPHLTEEQEAILAAAARGESMVVRAGAGCGKTFTLAQIPKAVRQRRPSARIVFTAYNTAIVNEARAKLPRGTRAATNHGLAYGKMADMMGEAWMKRLPKSKDGKGIGEMRRQSGSQIARILGMSDFAVTIPGNGGLPDELRTFGAGTLAGYVRRAVEVFCASEALEPALEHIPPIRHLDDGEAQEKVAAYMLPYVRKAWEDMSALEGRLTLSHDVYLKLWALGGPTRDVPPVIGADVIMVDESQDLTGVMLTILAAQAGAQIILVGDSAQELYCQPVGTVVREVSRDGTGRGQGRGGPRWTHSEKPIEDIVVGDRLVSYDVAGAHLRVSGSFVTAVHRERHIGDIIEVKMEGGWASRYTPDHHCVVRIADALDGKYVVYLMRRGNQFRVGMVPWRYASQNGNSGPSLRARAEGADAFWVLSAHPTASDARLAEAIISHRYGVPTWCFRKSNHSVPLAEFWEAVGDNTRAAAGLLESVGRHIDAPLWDMACGGMLTRRAMVVRACNLMDGMRMLPADAVKRDRNHRRNVGTRGAGWEPISVSRVPFEGDVISLTVDGDHTYVGDGIITHNSYRGAVNAMDRFIEEQPGITVLTLSVSFRFGPRLAEFSNNILDAMAAPLRLVGAGPADSRIGELDYCDAILCRTNAGVMRSAIGVLRQALTCPHCRATLGDPEGSCPSCAAPLPPYRLPCLLGAQGDDLKDFCRAALVLQEGGRTENVELSCFDTWEQVLEYVADDPAGADLKLMVQLVEEYGAQALLDMLEAMPDKPEAGRTTTISTVHRTKGLEWPTVQVGDDFKAAETVQEIPKEELRVLYVAATRAKNVLDPFGCDPLLLLLR